MRRQAYADAVDSYTNVLKIDQAVPAAWIERAQAFAALRNYERAAADVEKYLEITDPKIHRSERVKASELLRRYEAAAAGRPLRPIRSERTRPTRPPQDDGYGGYAPPPPGEGGFPPAR